MLAQAVLEKGILEGMTLGISNFVTEVGNVVEANPYLVIGVGVAVLFFLLRRRR